MGPFPEDGAASHSQYFTKGVKPNSCDLVKFPTGYSLYNKNDYKRCVCDSWMMEAEDCIRGDPEQTSSPIPTETEKDKRTDQEGAEGKEGEGKPEQAPSSPTGRQGDRTEETTDVQQTTKSKETSYESK